MSETLIIAILAIVVFFLYGSAKKQKRRSREVRKRMVDKAWNHEDR